MIIILLFFIIMKKVNTMFLLVYIKIWDYSFGSIFVQKYIVSLSVFFFQFDHDFWKKMKDDAIFSFLLNQNFLQN